MSWFDLLPELQALIRPMLNIRARINLKRTSRENYRADGEKEFILALEDGDKLAEMYRCQFLNVNENIAIQQHRTAKQQLLRCGALDLIWTGRFSATGSTELVVKPSTRKYTQDWRMTWITPEETSFTLSFNLGGHMERSHWKYEHAMKVGGTTLCQRETLAQLVQSMGYERGIKIFSKEFMLEAPPLI